MDLDEEVDNGEFVEDSADFDFEAAFLGVEYSEADEEGEGGEEDAVEGNEDVGDEGEAGEDIGDLESAILDVEANLAEQSSKLAEKSSKELSKMKSPMGNVMKGFRPTTTVMKLACRQYDESCTVVLNNVDFQVLSSPQVESWLASAVKSSHEMVKTDDGMKGYLKFQLSSVNEAVQCRKELNELLPNAEVIRLDRRTDKMTYENFKRKCKLEQDELIADKTIVIYDFPENISDASILAAFDGAKKVRRLRDIKRSRPILVAFVELDSVEAVANLIKKSKGVASTLSRKTKSDTACRFFYSTAGCKRPDCKFRHEESDEGTLSENHRIMEMGGKNVKIQAVKEDSLKLYEVMSEVSEAVKVVPSSNGYDVKALRQFRLLVDKLTYFLNWVHRDEFGVYTLPEINQAWLSIMKILSRSGKTVKQASVKQVVDVSTPDRGHTARNKSEQQPVSKHAVTEKPIGVRPSIAKQGAQSVGKQRGLPVVEQHSKKRPANNAYDSAASKHPRYNSVSTSPRNATANSRHPSYNDGIAASSPINSRAISSSHPSSPSSRGMQQRRISGASPRAVSSPYSSQSSQLMAIRSPPTLTVTLNNAKNNNGHATDSYTQASGRISRY